MKPYYSKDGITIYNADCMDVMPALPEKSFDLILVDPPYPKKYSYTYDYLANECPRIMKRGASLITIVGHYAIPDIIEKFRNKLKYRWIFAMNQFNGRHARMAMGIEVMWKPILWYVKDAYPNGRGFIRDSFDVSGNSGQKKENHKWEQDISWANFFIEKLTNKSDIILDPLMGSGTVLLAAKKLGRKAAGIEISKEYCDIAIERIENANKQLNLLDISKK